MAQRKVLAGRKPTLSPRLAGCRPFLLAERATPDRSLNAPPRSQRPSSLTFKLLSISLPALLPPKTLFKSPAVSHQVHNVPCISKNPRSLGLSMPTGQVWFLEFSSNQPYLGSKVTLSPKEKAVSTPA